MERRPHPQCSFAVLAAALAAAAAAALAAAGEPKEVRNDISRDHRVAVGTFGQPIAPEWSELVFKTRLTGADVRTGPLDKLKDKGTRITWSAVYARAPFTMWVLNEGRAYYEFSGDEKEYKDISHRMRSYTAATGRQIVGERVHATVGGGLTWPGTGTAGPGPSPGGRHPDWFSLAVDMDMDADSNRSGVVADVNLNSSEEARAEDKIENDPENNPVGALVAVGGKAPLILRKLMEVDLELKDRLPSLIEGHVLIVALDGSDGGVQVFDPADGKPALEYYKAQDAVDGSVCRLRADLFKRMLKGEDVKLDMVGQRPGTVVLHALLSVRPAGSEAEPTEFADTVRVSVVDLVMLAGRVEPETGRGAAGAPGDVLYEPEALPVAASNPVPKVKLSKVEVGYIRGGLDSPIVADIRIEGEVYCPLADIVEGDEANPTKVFVELNGQPLQTLDLAVVKEQPSILRPFARKFTYAGTLAGAPLALKGFSGLVVKCREPAVGNVGYAGARIEIEPVTSAEPYDHPIGESLHAVVTGGTAQPLKAMVDLSRGRSLAHLAGLGPKAIGTRAKLSFGGDNRQSVQRGGLQFNENGEPVIVLADGVSKITIKDASELTFDDRQEGFKAEVYLPEKWPDPVEMVFVETGLKTSEFQSFVVGVELTLPGGELDPDNPDAVTAIIKAVGYDRDVRIGEWTMDEDGKSSLAFWGDDEKTVGLKIECLTPPSKWSFGFIRMRVFNGQAWGVDGMPVDVGQKYIGVNIYDQEHLIQEVPGALDARLAIATGPWQLRQVVMLQESQPGPYTPFVARLRGPAAALAEIKAGTKCRVFDRDHTWSAEYGETWCGGSSKPGVFTMMELPVPGKDFGAGHLDSEARFVFFSVSGRQQYEFIQTKRKNACRVAGRLFEVLREVAANRRANRFDVKGDPGLSYPHFVGPSLSTPKRYRQHAVAADAVRLLHGRGTAFTRDAEGFRNLVEPFPDYFNFDTGEYLDPRCYLGAAILDFLETSTMEHLALGRWYPDPRTSAVEAALDKMSTSCGMSPVFSNGANALYHCCGDCGIGVREISLGVWVEFPVGIERGLVVKMAACPSERYRTIDKNVFKRQYRKYYDEWGLALAGLDAYYDIPPNGYYGLPKIASILRLSMWGRLQFPLPRWESPKAKKPVLRYHKAESIVLIKHRSPGSVHSVGSKYLIGQHTPFRPQGFGATEDPLSNSQNGTQILHFNTGMSYGRYLSHVNEMLALLKAGGAGRDKRLLEYMAKNKLLPANHQDRLNSIARLPGGFGLAACYVSRVHQFGELLIALKMVQAWEKQTGMEPTPLDFFTAYDIASGEGFHLFGIDAFNDVIATQAGYLFHDTLLAARLPRPGKSYIEEIREIVRLMEEDIKKARGQFRKHVSLNGGLGNGTPASAKESLLNAFLAMQLTHGSEDGKHIFVPVLAVWEGEAQKLGLDGEPIVDSEGNKVYEKVTRRGRIWDETIGTVVDANLQAGVFTAADDPGRERIDDVREHKFLESVRELLTVPTHGFMASECKKEDGAIVNSRAVLKLNEMVEVLMFLDEDP